MANVEFGSRWNRETELAQSESDRAFGIVANEPKSTDHPAQPTTPHTATPWRKFDADSLEVVGADGHTVAEVYQCGGIREINEADANAALIVTAVNSHVALIETLDSEETAYQNTLAGWEAIPRRERNVLSPRRYFFHAGYAAALAEKGK